MASTRIEKIEWLVILVMVAWACFPTISPAHSLFIQSSRYEVNEGKRSPLFFSYGHHFPVDDGVRAKKLKSVRVIQPGGMVEDVAIRDETCLHSYMVSYDMPGTYVLAAETNPGYYTVYKDKKGRERHAIKPKSAILDQASEVTKSLYAKQYTKTYVVCETPSETFPAKIGLPLELVPEKDVATLKAGDTLSLKVYLNGQPYEGEGSWDATYNGFSTVAEDNFYPKQAVTGDSVEIFVPRPGRWYVRYFIKIEATGADKEQFTHMKHTATLVFQIPNERKRAKSSGH